MPWFDSSTVSFGFGSTSHKQKTAQSTRERDRVRVYVIVSARSSLSLVTPRQHRIASQHRAHQSLRFHLIIRIFVSSVRAFDVCAYLLVKSVSARADH